MTANPNLIAWGLAAAGGACSVMAAFLAGGKVAAWGAAGTALMGAAGVLGWQSKKA